MSHCRSRRGPRDEEHSLRPRLRDKLGVSEMDEDQPGSVDFLVVHRHRRDVFTQSAF